MGHRLGREDLQRVGAGAPGGEGLGGREHAGHRAHAALARPAASRQGRNEATRTAWRRCRRRRRPAPSRAPCPRRPTRRRAPAAPGWRWRRSRPGRFSGTSSARKPASNSTWATSAARSGCRPRRMATSGSAGGQAASDGAVMGRSSAPARARRPAGSAAHRASRGVGHGGGRRRRAGGQRGLADHAHGLVARGQALGVGPFGADQQAAHVGAARAGRERARDDARARAEQRMRERRAGGRGGHAAQEFGMVGDVGVLQSRCLARRRRSASRWPACRAGAAARTARRSCRCEAR